MMLELRDVSRLLVLPRCGWEGKDPKDDRDWDFGATDACAQSAEIDVDLSSYFKDVSDQMAYPSCVANAVADMWEARSIIAKVESGMALEQAKAVTPDLSRMFLWWCARNAMDPNQAKNPNIGTYNRLAMDAIARHGVPNETDWPYDNELVGAGTPRAVTRPSIKAFRNAFANACSAFYGFPQVGEQLSAVLVKSLVARCPVVCGTLISREVTGYRQGVLSIPSGPIVGAHAFVIVGWSGTLQAFKVRSSWTKSWGLGGYAWISKAYVEWEETGGFWTASHEVL